MILSIDDTSIARHDGGTEEERLVSDAAHHAMREEAAARRAAEEARRQKMRENAAQKEMARQATKRSKEEEGRFASEEAHRAMRDEEAARKAAKQAADEEAARVAREEAMRHAAEDAERAKRRQALANETKARKASQVLPPIQGSSETAWTADGRVMHWEGKATSKAGQHFKARMGRRRSIDCAPAASYTVPPVGAHISLDEPNQAIQGGHLRRNSLDLGELSKAARIDRGLPGLPPIGSAGSAGTALGIRSDSRSSQKGSGKPSSSSTCRSRGPAQLPAIGTRRRGSVT